MRAACFTDSEKGTFLRNMAARMYSNNGTFRCCFGSETVTMRGNMLAFSFNSTCLHPYLVKRARFVLLFKNGSRYATVYDQYRVQITSALIGLTDIVLFQRSAHRKIYKLSLTGNNLPLESCVACKLVSACLSGPPLAAPSAALHEARWKKGRRIRPSVQLWGLSIASPPAPPHAGLSVALPCG